MLVAVARARARELLLELRLKVFLAGVHEGVHFGMLESRIVKDGVMRRKMMSISNALFNGRDG